MGENEWEAKFRSWASPPGTTEEQRCQNAIGAVRNAIEASTKLKHRKIKVILQGSYNNNTNTKGESDVDIGVVCSDSFFYSLPSGVTADSANISAASYLFPAFKNELGEALREYFGAAAVSRGNKAFDVKETSYHVEADVAPFFPHRRYSSATGFEEGVEMNPDSDLSQRIINWPDQHYANGVEKNKATGMRFKAIVRVLKSLRNEMLENNITKAAPAIGFLSECLVWNAPNIHFGDQRYYADLRRIVAALYVATKEDAACNEWGEVSERKYLFRQGQKWTRQQANEFLVAVWSYVGFTP